MKKTLAILIGLALISSSCKKLAIKVDVPVCIKQKIRKISSEKAQNPPAKVWEWKVDGASYYYFTSSCCDQFNYLYDKKCKQICAPSGGFSGKGDGKCPDFKGTIEKTLIWEDTRK
jgi:hypothetical protein